MRPSAPALADDGGWCRSDLDRFVLARMHEHELSPSPLADRATFLRRVTLDLTGLPPTPAAVDAFVADEGTDADAEARVVDRLLASPEAAERWTQWWLDLARYADSQGYEKDSLRPTMWRYRDWVLDAFAHDMPFDEFTIEQLAGDLLPNATNEQHLATAFHRQTMTNTEGGTDDEEFRTAAVIDRVDTTMSVWMGSTLGCARCHDHKFDPFSQREFFQLFAFFDQTADHDSDDDAPKLTAPTAQQQAAAKVVELRLTELRRQLQVDDAKFLPWVARQQQAQRDFAAAAPQSSRWHVLGPIPAADFHTAHTKPFAPERDGVQLDAEQEGQRWRTEDYADGVVQQWTGDNSAVYLHRTIVAAHTATALLSLGSDDAIKVWWNGELLLDKEVGRAALPDQELLPVTLRAGDNTILLKVTNGGGPSGFYFDLRASGLPAAVVKLLDSAPWTPAERELVAATYLAQAPEFDAVRKQIADSEQEFESYRGPDVPVLRELPADKRRTTHVHRHGNFMDPGDVVEAGTPKVWPPLPPDAPPNRLTLARWLMSRDNPLTARVLANRIWSELFGAGIVPTLEDFGTQGDAPSHPLLLDWLAIELRDGWSLRHLLRTIVLSATYAQSSVQTAERREQDPENRWLARGPSFRLSAEMLRDQALAVSGLLVDQRGGPSVMPPQPDGVWMQIYSGERWVAATDGDRYRRALYTFWRRTSPHPAMLVFDAQSRESCVLRRQRTNTPLQALVLWNDPQFREPALKLAHGAIDASLGDDARGVQWMWRQCLLRPATASEQTRLLSLLADERTHFAADPDAVKQVCASGREGLPLELAAWSVVASVVMSLDEFVTRL